MRPILLTSICLTVIAIEVMLLPPAQPAPRLIRRPKSLTGTPTKAEIKAVQKAWAEYLGVPVEKKVKLSENVYLELVLIPPGTFWMGSPEGQKGRGGDEFQHEVELTKPFYLGKYEVTQEQYQAITGKNPSNSKGAKLPVESVTWDEADAFTKKLKEKAGGKLLFRLPTEAEWEYSCRGGVLSKNCLPFHLEDGPSASLPATAANFNYNNKGTKPVGLYRPNRFGLSDMHGNVWEWCVDRYRSDYADRVIRGGCWRNNGAACSASSRGCREPDYRDGNVGFRLLAVPSGSK